MLKFSANVSTLFHELPFLQRFNAAKNFGFTYVEMQEPYEYSPMDIKTNMSGLDCDLINAYTGEVAGFASVPGKEYDFCLSLDKMLQYQSILNFHKVHILSGMRRHDITEEEQINAFISSLDSATDMLEDNNIVGLIEPICKEVKENYFLSSFEMAIKVIEGTSNSNIKLLLDIYHLHKITGDVKGNLEKYYPYAGHIQISQDPGRCEPFHPDGKIDYGYVFEFLKEKNHKDVIGLEYFPSGTTEESLQWVKKYF